MELDELLEKSTNTDPIYMDNRQNLLKSLYSLSLGDFWFEIGEESIPMTHPDWELKYPKNSFVMGIDYLVLQLFQDLEEFIPVILQPIPAVLAQLIKSGAWLLWKAKLDQVCGGPSQNDVAEPYRDFVHPARFWWSWRKLEFWYLVAPPDIYIWSSDPEILHLNWNTCNKHIEDILNWVETSGEVKMTRTAFLQAMTEFQDSLLTELAQRIMELLQLELIDTQGYERLKEQIEVWREQFNDAMTKKIDDTDWRATLDAIKTLEPLIGPMF